MALLVKKLLLEVLAQSVLVGKVRLKGRGASRAQLLAAGRADMSSTGASSVALMLTRQVQAFVDVLQSVCGEGVVAVRRRFRGMYVVGAVLACLFSCSLVWGHLVGFFSLLD